MKTAKAPRHRALLLVFLVTAIAAGMVLHLRAPRAPTVPPGTARPLLEHAVVEALAESDAVALPPATAGSRFVSGWIPRRVEGQKGALELEATTAARLEVVATGGEPRRVVFEVVAAPVSAEPMLARVCGREQTIAIAGGTGATLELELPADLEPGACTIELAGAEGLRVRGAALRPAAAPGGAEIGAGTIDQHGASVVEIVVPIHATDSALRGRLEPPADGSGRFVLEIRDAAGELLGRFGWQRGRFGKLLSFASRGSQDFVVPLARIGEGEGASEGWRWIRLRMIARGAQQPGRWRDLEIVGAKPVNGRAATEGRPYVRERNDEPPRVVVLYVLDALRADHLGHLGGPEGISPEIDRLAAEGLVAARHRSVAPNTLPSTKSLFTGRTWLTQGGWKLAPEDGLTLAERFRAAGYRTGLFTGNVYVGPAYGTDRGFETVVEEPVSEAVGRGPGAPWNDNAARLHRAALDWLRSLPPGSPAFLCLHVIHPHNPYAPPPDLEHRFTAGIASTIDGSSATLLAIRNGRLEPSAADQARLRGLYAGAVAYADRELARFAAELGALAPGPELLVALTADHGEELFDHGGVLHGYTLHEEMLRIPLLVWSPERIAPRRIAEPTDTLDLHATLAALLGDDGAAGADASAGADAVAASAGRDLLRALPAVARAPRLDLAAASSLKGGLFAAHRPRWKVIFAPRTGAQWGMGEGRGRSRDAEYVFDLAADPGETRNLAGVTRDPEVAWMRGRLRAWMASAGSAESGESAAAPAGQASPPVDEETRRRLQALGYVD